MCGICGVVNFEGKPVAHHHIKNMVAKLAHRGPDHEGIYHDGPVGLGHRRLSIIDLSSAGHQPMGNENGKIQLVFNGEIYNFLQLKAQLQQKGHVFRSNSDSEVIIHAYEEWGEDSWNLLEGIFAFGLWDAHQQTLILVRDHLGVKPLFYYHQDKRLAFSSELLAIFGPHQPVPDTNWEDVDCYFTYNYLPAPRSGLKNVSQLPAATALNFSNHGLTAKRYWRPTLVDIPSPPTTEQKVELLDRITQSVHSQLLADVPVGIFLSGGLDSFAVMHGAVLNGKTPHAYTLGFEEPGFDESKDAAQYLSHLGSQGSTINLIWNQEEISNSLEAMGELLADASCFPFYQLCRFASEGGHKVCLSGDGGDELWAGYDTYFASKWLTPLLRLLPGPFTNLIEIAAKLLPSDNQRYGARMILKRLLAAANAGPGRDHASFRRIFSDDLKKKLYCSNIAEHLYSSDPISEYTRWADEAPLARSNLSKYQYMDVMFHLPSILAKVDRMSMAHGLEVRVPLLDRKLVDFSLNISDTAKRQGRRGKMILREALKPYIPPHTLKRGKAGFLPPVDRWFRGRGPMWEIFGDHLSYASNNLDGLRWDKVANYWSDHRAGRVDGGFVLLGILQYINWSIKCHNAGLN